MEFCTQVQVRFFLTLQFYASGLQLQGAGGIFGPFVIEALLVNYGQKVTLLAIVSLTYSESP